MAKSLAHTTKELWAYGERLLKIPNVKHIQTYAHRVSPITSWRDGVAPSTLLREENMRKTRQACIPTRSSSAKAMRRHGRPHFETHKRSVASRGTMVHGPLWQERPTWARPARVVSLVYVRSFCCRLRDNAALSVVAAPRPAAPLQSTATLKEARRQREKARRGRHMRKTCGSIHFSRWEGRLKNGVGKRGIPWQTEQRQLRLVESSTSC